MSISLGQALLRSAAAASAAGLPAENARLKAPTPAVPVCAAEPIVHEERVHHPCSPSTLQTREASPCWIPRSGPGGEAAVRGTLQHEASERGEDLAELTDEEVAAVAQTHDLIAAAEQELGPCAVVTKEPKLSIDDEPVVDPAGNKFTGTTSGFADVVVLSADGKRGCVLDWKFGKFAVERAENNLQGMAYALGLVHAQSTRGIRMESVKVLFFSPHIEDCSQHVFGLDELGVLRVRVMRVVARSKQVLAAIAADPENRANYHPSTTACLFCGRLADCPAVLDWVVAVSKKYQPVTTPEDIRGFNLTGPNSNKLMVLTGIAAAWAKEVRARIQEFVLMSPDGFLPDGYSLVQSWPRKVVDARKLETVARKHGITDEEWYEKVIDIPITTVEKTISAKAPRGQKAEQVAAFSAEAESVGAVRKSDSPVVALRMKGKTDADAK